MTAAVTSTTTPPAGWRLGGRGGKQRLIPDPTTGELLAYQRTSTFAKTLDDKEGLIPWKAWMALRGAQHEPALREAALHATSTPRGVIEQLAEAGGAGEKRDRGSARHTILAMALTGATLPTLTDPARAELDSVLALVASLGTVVATEAPLVCDEWRVSGSCDMVLRAPDGTTVVADFKTGASVQLLEWSIQLVAYARSHYWDWDTETRRDLVATSRPRLVVIHAPQGGAAPCLIELDPDHAKAWADLAYQVREARKQASALARERR